MDNSDFQSFIPIIEHDVDVCHGKPGRLLRTVINALSSPLKQIKGIKDLVPCDFPKEDHYVSTPFILLILRPGHMSAV